MRASPRFLAALLLAPLTLHALVDINHDGVSEIWQAAYPTAGATGADPDGDGFSNAEEARAGTDPLDSSDHPAARLHQTTPGETVLTWPSLSSKRYTVQSSTDLRTWNSTGTLTGTGTELSRTVIDAGTSVPAAQFWRVQPLDSDTDNDGLSNWEESKLGASPTNQDSDADGLPDLWEARHDTNPALANASADPDGDGFSNLREYAAGTDPQFRTLPVSGGPIVFWASQPVAPNETILATCAGTDLGSTAELARLPDTAPGSPLAAAPAPTGWTALTPHTATPRSVTVTVPVSWTQGIYALRLKEAGTTGPVHLVNRPDPWFVQGDQGDTATPGGTLTVAGTCLEIVGPASLKPRAALVRNGAVSAELTEPTRLTTSTGYALRYTVPADLAEGDYQLYLHNGCGGPAGWVKFATFIEQPLDTVTVRAAVPWPTTVFNVSTMPGSSDDARFAAALARAKANQGGRIYVPAGAYTLTTRLLLPARSVLVGAGRDRTTIRWSVVPAVVAPFADYNPLVAGEPLAPKSLSALATFAIEDITLESSAAFTGNLVLRMSTAEPGWIRRATLLIPTPSGSGGTPAALFLRRTANTLLDDLVLDSPVYCLYGRDTLSYLRLTGSTLNWRGMNVWLGSGSHNLLFTGNTLHLLGDPVSNGWAALSNPNPGFFFTVFHGKRYARDLLWSGNRSTREEPHTFTVPEYAGFSGDGSIGGYRGPVTGVAGTTVTLAGTIGTYTPPTGSPPDWAGAILQILDGRGAGQWRHVTSALPDTATITIDRPWAVAPDSTSTVALSDFLGRVLMVDNDFAEEPLNSDYYFSLDSIKAGNRLGVAGAKSALISWSGRHYQGTLPGWHLQVLGNRVERGPLFTFKSQVTAPAIGYTGTIGAAHIFRGNTNSSGQPADFLLRTLDGPFADALVEHNQFTSIVLEGRQSSDQPFAVSGVLLRANTDPTSSSASPINAGKTNSVFTPTDTLPGVTVVP